MPSEVTCQHCNHCFVPQDIQFRHRLMCGDSTKKEDVERLMDGKKADMILTDPPFNVAFKDRTEEQRSIRNDDMDKGDFIAFLSSAMIHCFSFTKSNPAFYLFFATMSIREVLDAVDRTSWKINQWIIWVKDLGSRQLTHAYRWRFEPILYLVKDKLPDFYATAGSETNVWEFAGMTSFAARKDDDTRVMNKQSENLHPNRKPLDLLRKAIINSSQGDELIIEPFAGSGSTLIACEQTNRICYGMEIDPRYVDVICRRWRALTSKQPQRLSDGKTFVELENGADKPILQ